MLRIPPQTFIRKARTETPKPNHRGGVKLGRPWKLKEAATQKKRTLEEPSKRPRGAKRRQRTKKDEVNRLGNVRT